MTTNFPTALDTLTNPTGTDDVSVVDHAAQHADANDAIEALQTKVGIDGSAVPTSLTYQMAAKAPIASPSFTGGTTVTSSLASASPVGRLGGTTPAWDVDASVALCVTGAIMQANTAGNGSTLQGTSSAANENLFIRPKGTGVLALYGGNGTYLQSGTAQFTGAGAVFAYSFRGFTANTAYSFTGLADSNLTAATECSSFDLNFAQVKTHLAGAITTQRDIRLRASTHAFASASTITDSIGVALEGAPIAGTNATITRSTTFDTGTANVGAGTATSYGARIRPNTGATTNYAARIDGAIDLGGAGAGTSGYVLTSAGAGAVPTWAAPGGGGGGIDAGYNMAIRNKNF